MDYLCTCYQSALCRYLLLMYYNDSRTSCRLLDDRADSKTGDIGRSVCKPFFLVVRPAKNPALPAPANNTFLSASTQACTFWQLYTLKIGHKVTLVALINLVRERRNPINLRDCKGLPCICGAISCSNFLGGRFITVPLDKPGSIPSCIAFIADVASSHPCCWTLTLPCRNG